MPTDLPPFSVAMLAGGAGLRLGGVDKSRLVIDDDEIGTRTIVTALLSGASEVLAIGGDPEALGDQGWPFIPDRWPGEGPLGGLITALNAASHDWVVIVGCDQPDLTAESLIALMEEAVDAVATPDAVVTVIDGFPHVTHSVWNRTVCGQLESAFDAGQRSVKAAMTTLNIRHMTPADDGVLSDIDTPADLIRRQTTVK
jgi:molybdenum cofactor guanylyltransferase